MIQAILATAKTSSPKIGPADSPGRSINTMNRLAILVGLALCAAVIGCGDGMPDNPPYTKPSAQTFDDQIAKVKADPNMSEQAKQQAIKGIEMARSMSQQGGQKAGK